VSLRDKNRSPKQKKEKIRTKETTRERTKKRDGGEQE